MRRDIGFIAENWVLREPSKDWRWESVEDGLGSFRRRFDLLLLCSITMVLITHGAALLEIVGRHGNCEETERVRMMRTRICGEEYCAHVSVSGGGSFKTLEARYVKDVR